jgi:hypothetical protein
VIGHPGMLIGISRLRSEELIERERGQNPDTGRCEEGRDAIKRDFANSV